MSGSATVAETGAQARITLPSSTAGTHLGAYRSATTYDATADSFYINIETMVATGVAATAFFDLLLDANNYLRWRQVSNTITARTVVAGVDTQQFTATWSGTTYKYLRIRESGGNILFDSSTNGTSYTNRATVAVSSLFEVTALFVQWGATCGNVASPGSFRLDDVNLILPALTTNWRWAEAIWGLTNRHKRVTIAIDTAGTAQGYLVTADGVDSSDAPSGNIQYWSGPASGGRTLTSQPDQTSAENMAVDLPLDGSFDLPVQIDARCFRLYARSIDGSAFTIREFYPRRLVQSDDVEAESIRTINLAANSITADKLAARLIISNEFTTAYNGARVKLSGAAFGGFIGYGATDTYDTATGTGTYQVLWSLADGALYAGGGVVKLDAQGIVVTGSTSYLSTRAYGFTDGTNRTGDLYSIEGASSHSMRIDAYQVTSKDSDLTFTSDAPTGKVSNINLNTRVNGVIGPQIQLQHATSAINLNGGDVFVTGGNVNAGNGLNVGTATAAAAGQAFVTYSDASTTSVPSVLVIGHNSSATPAAGFGSTTLWNLNSSTTDDTAAMQLNVTWVTATHASRAARAQIYAYDTAARECIRIEASGTAPMIGFLGTAAVVRQTVGAAAPAGGTGATAGAYDTAAHRDSMITLLNNIRTAGINLGLWQN